MGGHVQFCLTVCCMYSTSLQYSILMPLNDIGDGRSLMARVLLDLPSLPITKYVQPCLGPAMHFSIFAGMACCLIRMLLLGLSGHWQFVVPTSRCCSSRPADRYHVTLHQRFSSDLLGDM